MHKKKICRPELHLKPFLFGCKELKKTKYFQCHIFDTFWYSKVSSSLIIFFQIFVISQSTEILIESKFWLGM